MAVVMIGAIPMSTGIKAQDQENKIRRAETVSEEICTQSEDDQERKLEPPYFIEYKITDSEGNIRKIAKAEDEQGRIYYKDGLEYLFVPEGENYILYYKDGAEDIHQKNKVYQAYEVQEQTKEFEDYIQKPLLALKNSQYEGEEIILGRVCDVYEMTIGFKPIFRQSYKYLIDQETGICMGMYSERKIAGVKEIDGESFLCTHFEIGNMDLIEEYSQSSV